MRWQIDGAVRVLIHAFTGINFSGQRVSIDIWPTGGRQAGDEIDGTRLKSIGMIAPFGTRVILCASASDEGWERLPWRAFEIREGFTFASQSGQPAVQLPDIDFVDPPGALRTDPDFHATYPHVEDPTERPSWTYGRVGHSGLKCNVRQIRVDRV